MCDFESLLRPEACDSRRSSLDLPFLVAAGLLRQPLLLPQQTLPCVLPGSLAVLCMLQEGVMGACQWSWAGLAGSIMRASRRWIQM